MGPGVMNWGHENPGVALHSLYNFRSLLSLTVDSHFLKTWLRKLWWGATSQGESSASQDHYRIPKSVWPLLTSPRWQCTFFLKICYKFEVRKGAFASLLGFLPYPGVQKSAGLYPQGSVWTRHLGKQNLQPETPDSVLDLPLVTSWLWESCLLPTSPSVK